MCVITWFDDRSANFSSTHGVGFYKLLPKSCILLFADKQPSEQN